MATQLYGKRLTDSWISRFIMAGVFPASATKKGLVKLTGLFLFYTDPLRERCGRGKRHAALSAYQFGDVSAVCEAVGCGE